MESADPTVHQEAANLVSIEELNRLINELQSIFRGQRSLEDDLYEMRREEEIHWQRKYGYS